MKLFYWSSPQFLVQALEAKSTTAGKKTALAKEDKDNEDKIQEDEEDKADVNAK